MLLKATYMNSKDGRKSKALIIGPNLSEFDDFGHRVTVGNSTSSIGNDVESKMSMTGSSIHTEKVLQLQIFKKQCS